MIFAAGTQHQEKCVENWYFPPSALAKTASIGSLFVHIQKTRLPTKKTVINFNLVRSHDSQTQCGAPQNHIGQLVKPESGVVPGATDLGSPID